MHRCMQTFLNAIYYLYETSLSWSGGLYWKSRIFTTMRNVFLPLCCINSLQSNCVSLLHTSRYSSWLCWPGSCDQFFISLTHFCECSPSAERLWSVCITWSMPEWNIANALKLLIRKLMNSHCTSVTVGEQPEETRNWVFTDYSEGLSTSRASVMKHRKGLSVSIKTMNGARVPWADKQCGKTGVLQIHN